MWDHTDAARSLSPRVKLDALEGLLVRKWEVEDVEGAMDVVRTAVCLDVGRL